MLDLAAEFIDPEERVYGNTLVLEACEGYGSGLDPDILNALISRGSNIFAHSHQTGDTCLHNAVRSLRGRYHDPQIAKSRVFLVTLLNAGLKVSDKNDAGNAP